jgi:hypothetical protein
MNISLSKHSNSSSKIYVTLRFFLPKTYLESLFWTGLAPYTVNTPLKFHSILLQYVCDHKQRFLNVCVKAPSGCLEAAHLKVSKL